VIGTWDDHDYGINNGGKEFPAKERSQKALLDFLDEPLDSPRRSQEGVYWSYDYGSGERSVKLILLDVRYHREAPRVEGMDNLGTAQWEWLEGELQDSTARLNVVVSGIQVLPVDHRYEKWQDFPASRSRLLDACASADGRVVFLSGDRHIAEFSRVVHEASGEELLEVTASSMTHSWKSFPGEANRHRIDSVYSENNFGTIEIDWDEGVASLQIRSEVGEVVREMKVSI